VITLASLAAARLWHAAAAGSIFTAEGRKESSTMEMARFGKTGMKVSRLCLGCMTYGSTKWRDWVLDEEASRPFIREALERGINFFDTADMYSVGASEEVLGRALKEYAKRDEVVVATKVFNPMGPGPNARGLSRKHITEAIDASLTTSTSTRSTVSITKRRSRRPSRR
jgi:diketogulonate reductase-like aldo/keto reductase